MAKTVRVTSGFLLGNIMNNFEYDFLANTKPTIVAVDLVFYKKIRSTLLTAKDNVDDLLEEFVDQHGTRKASSKRVINMYENQLDDLDRIINRMNREIGES